MDIAAHLERYIDIPGVEAAFLFGADGLLISATLREDADPTLINDPLPAIAAQATAYCQQIGELLVGEPRTITIEGDAYTLVLQALPEENAFAALVADKGVNLGLLRLQSARLRRDLLKCFASDGD